jgi:hypothetical protein
MEYLTVVNIVTALVVLLMIGCVIKIFTGDIGTNRTFYITAFIVLGIVLYLWRSGVAVGILSNIFGVAK